jgi:hypothetical protein
MVQRMTPAIGYDAAEVRASAQKIGALSVKVHRVPSASIKRASTQPGYESSTHRMISQVTSGTIASCPKWTAIASAERQIGATGALLGGVYGFFTHDRPFRW